MNFTFHIALWSVLLHLCRSQQFSDFPMGMHQWSGMSDLCLEALNTTVSCPAFLGEDSVDNPRMNPKKLVALCVPSCLTSLNRVRETIRTACAVSTDVMVYEGIIYPATFIVDRFLYTYQLSCLKDKTTNEFCDTLLIDWLSLPDINKGSKDCSDCLLAAQQVQLNSPFGYDADFASNFGSTTSSCGSSGYAFTIPPPYASTTSTTEPPATTPSTCLNSYVVQNGDSCDHIASTHNVSTFSIILPNNLNDRCTNLQAGATICLADACSIYQVQEEDTCQGIIASTKTNITDTQFLAWNPNINSLCSNLYRFVGNYLCLSPPGGSLGNVVPTKPLAISTATTAVAKPTNAFPESNANCARWYMIQGGDFCDKVSVTFGISLKDFYFLNPEINTDCSNLILGVSYCVQAVGSIAGYPNYTTSQYFTLTTASYSTTTVPLVTDFPTPTYSSTALLPTAPGTTPDCGEYRNYEPIPPVIDQSEGTDQYVINAYVNQCVYWTSSYGVSLEDFIKWNPSLPLNECSLQPGFSYCLYSGTLPSAPIDNSGCIGINTALIVPGTSPSCSCFTTNYAFDELTCSDIAIDAKISVSKLISLNPWVGTDCDTAISAGLSKTDGQDYRPICIGSDAGTITSTTSPTTTSATIGPTQTGIAPSCTRFYTVKSGGSCAAIQEMFQITFPQFFAWNPAVGSNCENLFVDFSYCVAIATTTIPTSISTSPTKVPPPGPTQSGIPATCNAYALAESGDGCFSFAERSKITLENLYLWNPVLNNACENFWLGEAYCVGVGS